MGNSTTYNDLIAEQDPGGVALVQVEAFEPILGWSLYSGSTYVSTIVQRMAVHNFREIHGVSYIDPEEAPLDPSIPISTSHSLTSLTSIVSVTTTPGSFFFDINTSLLYINLPDSSSPYGKYLKSAFTLYYSTGMSTIGAAFVDNLGNVYGPEVANIPNLAKSAPDPFSGSISTGGGQVSFVNNEGAFDEIEDIYTWVNGKVQIYFGGDNLPFSEYRLLFTGYTQDPGWDESSFSLNVKDSVEKLMVQVPLQKYSLADASITTPYVYYGPGYVESLSAASRTVVPPGFTVGNPYPTTVTLPFTYNVSKTPTDIETWAATPILTGNELPLTTSRIPVNTTKPFYYGKHYGVTGTVISASPAEAIIQLSHFPLKSIDKITMNGIVLTPNATLLSIPSDRYPLGTTLGSIDAPLPTQAFSAYVSTDNRFVYLIGNGAQFYDLGSLAQSATFDIQGTANTDGTLMDNFADIVPDILSKCGVSIPINAAALDRTRFLCLNYTARIIISGTSELRAIIQSICASTLSYCFLNNAGELVFQTWCPDESNELLLQDESGDFLDIQLTKDGTRQIPVVTVEYGENLSAGTISGNPAAQPYLLQNQSTPESLGLIYKPVPFTISQSFQADEAGSFTLARRILRWAMKPAYNLVVRTKLKGMAIDLLQPVYISRARMPSGQTRAIHGLVISIKRSLSDDTVELELDDQRTTGIQAYLKSDGTKTWVAGTDEERQTYGYYTDYYGYPDTNRDSFGVSRYF